jgi:TM2 domain-containing membrane protein YozV
VTNPFDLPRERPAPSAETQYVPYQPPAFDEPDPIRPDVTPGYYAPDPAAALAVPTSAATAPQPITPYISTPDAPYGRDPATGEPLSNKNKVIAAFLQLIFGCFGAGRFYIGDTRTGFVTIGLVVIAIFTSAALPYGWILWPALGLWWISDFILMLSGHVHDAQGRQLK